MADVLAEIRKRRAQLQGGSGNPTIDAIRARRAELQAEMDREKAEREAEAAGSWSVRQGLQVGKPEAGATRPRRQNPDGSVSSELSITVPDPRTPGSWINIPSMYGGQEVPEEDAVARITAAGYRDPETGRDIQSYGSVDEAVSAAQARSNALPTETAPTVEIGSQAPSQAGAGSLLAGDKVDEVLDYANQMARMFSKTVLGNMGEEFAAGGDATLKWLFDPATTGQSWRQHYDRELATERGLVEKFRKESPTSAMAAEIAGGILPAVGAVRIGMGPAMKRLGRSFGPHVAQRVGRRSFGKRVAGGAGMGGLYGGVWGFGEGEGGPVNRAMSAVPSAGIGAGIGAAVPVVGAVARPIASATARQVAARRAGIHNRAVDPIQGALERGTKDVTGQVKQPLPGSLGVDLYPDTRGLFGESVARLDRFGNPARKAIDDRADAAGARITKSLDDELGPPEGPGAVAARLKAEYGSAQKAAYDKAYATDIPYTTSEAGSNILDALRRIPKGQHAPVIRETRDLMQLEAQPRGPFFARVHDDGHVSISRLPNVQELDYLTRILNEKAAKGTEWKGLGVKAISKKIRDELKYISGDYRQALYLGELRASAKEAAELGDKAIRTGMTRDEMQAAISELKNKHVELGDWIDQHLRGGMRNRIDEQVMRAKDPMAPSPTQAGNVARGAQRDPTTVRTVKDLTSPVTLEKIEFILGKEKTARLKGVVDESKEAILTRDTMVENVRQAGRRSLNEADAVDDAAEAAKLAATVSPEAGVLKAAMKRVRDAQRAKKPNKTAAAVVNALMKPADQDALTQIMRLRHKSERGLREARIMEQIMGAPAMAHGVWSENQR